MHNSEWINFSTKNPYLEMETSFFSLLLKMSSLLTTPNYIQNSSNSNSKPLSWLLPKKLSTLQAPNRTHKISKWYVWYIWKGNLLKTWRGCFWMEETLIFPPKPPGTFLNHVKWVHHGLASDLIILGWNQLVWPKIDWFHPKAVG